MTIKVLFYREEKPEDLPSLGKIAKLFGHDYIIVDPSGEWPKKSKTKGLFYNSLREVINDPLYKDYTWVLLSEKAELYLDEFEHPENNVIYCVGDDIQGFIDYNIMKPIARLKDKWYLLRLRPAGDSDWFAYVCLQIAIYDRYLRLK